MPAAYGLVMPASAFLPLDVAELEVRSVMRPGVVTVGDEASVRQAASTMLSHRVHAVLVCGRGGRSLGWITARGLLSWLGRDTSAARAAAAIDEPPTLISPSATMSDAAERLSEAGVGRLLVAHRIDDAPLGVVTELDVLAALA